MSLLLSEFPEHTYEQWHAAAEALLKGASFEQKLVTRTYEDITIQPIYRREDIAGLDHRMHLPGSGSLVRGSRMEGFLKSGWEVSQELRTSSPESLNSLVHEGLNGGQSEINIPVGCGTDECCKGGVRILTTADFETALSKVELTSISTCLQAGPSALPVAALFFASAEQAGIAARNLRGCIENDPLAELVAKGSLRQSLKVRFDHMAALTDFAIRKAPGFRTITAQGDVYHNAGATATQELAYIISTLVCYVEEMKSRGLSPESVMPHIRIRLSVGSDYFMEIAKIRAARMLWKRIATTYHADHAPIHIHASTSKWNKTTYDAHTNMLRVTAEAFAAVVGGVDSLHIGPYDEIAGHTDEFSRRIARNIHTILREECGLDRVIDPAGGSTYIEWLTDQIAARSWSMFQEIEKQGGMTTCLQNGMVQHAVQAVCNARFQNIRRRKDKIVGANMYPDLKGGKLKVHAPECKAAETAAGAAQSTRPAKIAISATSDMVEQAIASAGTGATRFAIGMAIGLNNPEGAPTVEALPPRRAAEEYEALRDASAAFASGNGTAPTILQLNMGPSGKYRLRADWTASFFEAAGFVVDGSRDFSNVEETVSALATSKATIAVITSDDATYLETVELLAKAVKKAKPGICLLVAGTPGDHEAAWRSAGVDEFVNVRSNNYELNEQLLKKAGVL